jgi:DNA helicase II / ATP-dependent DNA helicase PcrA
MSDYKLNKNQKQAVEYTDGPLLIVAGAGTGKTSVITKKIVHLIDSGLAKPEEILALTFTDKAAGEMEERVDEMLGTGYVDLQISTFHAFCQILLEEYGLEIGLSNHFNLLTQTDAWLMMREKIYDFKLDYYRPLGSPASHIHQLLSHFSKCKDELLSPEEYLDYVENLKLDKDEAEVEEKTRLSEVANAYHQYNKLLLDNNALDFGDLIYYSVKLLKKRKNILKKLQKRFKYILVDEFQDVNWSQYELIKLLSEKSQLTAVGDDDQSIYSFRGSNVSIIMRFKDDYKNAKEIILNQNYRSDQKILDFAYDSIQHNNPERLEEKLKINKQLTSGITTKDPELMHLHSQTLEREVRSVIDKIAELKTDSVSWDDFAILVRANSHVEPFVNALESSGIPYEYLASSGLYRQPVVIDCINFLRLVDNYHESSAVFRLLRMQFLKFDEADLQKLTRMSKKKSISYYEGLKRAGEFGVSREGENVCRRVLAWIHNGMKKAKNEKTTAVLYNFLEESGYLNYLTVEEESGNREVIRQIYQLKEFFGLVENYEKQIPDSHVSNFMEHLDNILDSGDAGKMYQPTDTPDSVNIITVHGAKGLEYKYVFVVNMVEERFPVRRKSQGITLPDELLKEKLPDNDFHYQEERRLFYVAATRAKEKLFLTSAEDYGGVRKKKLSRFLVELGMDNKGTIKDENNKTIDKLKQLEKLEQEKQAEKNYALPKKFSFSQLSAYQRCPYQYKLMHVLKIPMKGSASFSFGNTIHNTLQKFYEKVQELNSVKQDSLFGLPAENSVQSNIKVLPQEELLDLYKKNWIPDWYNNKIQREDYYKKGKELLRIFYKAQEGNWTSPVSLEGFFKIKVGDYLINGRIDRIDQQKDGTLEIIDYKTGKSKDKLSTTDKQQLLIYQIAAKSLPQYRHIGEVGKLTFYYVNDNLRTSFVGKEKDFEKLEIKLLDILDNIKNANFKPTPNKFVCQYCDFKEICEYKKL